MNVLDTNEEQYSISKLYLFMSLVFVFFCLYRLYVIHDFRREENLNYRKDINSLKFQYQ